MTTAVVGTVVVISMRGDGPVAGSTDEAGTGSVAGPSSFTISGDVKGTISPGTMVPLDLSFENSNAFELVVKGITVTVQDVDAPRADAAHACSVKDFKVRQVPRGVVVSIGVERSQDLSGLGLARDHWPAVGMRNRPLNQDGCKGAVLALDYKAKGAEVRR